MSVEETMNVIIFGDSIGAGQGVSPHQTWVTKLSASIEERYGDRFTVINASVNGNTTRMALQRIEYDVQSHGLKLMVLQFGINDSNYWQTDNGRPRVSPEAFRANLLEIADRAVASGARRVTINTNHPTSKQIPFTGRPHQEGNKLYNDIIRSVAEERKDMRLIDTEAAFERASSSGRNLNDLLLSDGIHLNARGNDLYLETISPVVLSELTEILMVSKRPRC